MIRWLFHRRIEGRWVAVLRLDDERPHRWVIVECRCSRWAILRDRLRELVGLP